MPLSLVCTSRFVPLPVCDHSQRVYLTPNRRRSIVFRVLFQQTNKHTNKHVCNDSLPHARGSNDSPLPPVPYLLSGRVLDGLTLTTAKKIAKRTSKLGRLLDGLLGPTWLFGCSPPAGPVIRLGLRHPRKKERERKKFTRIHTGMVGLPIECF